MKKLLQDVPKIAHPSQIAEGMLGRTDRGIYLGLANGRYRLLASMEQETTESSGGGSTSGSLLLAGLSGVLKAFGGSLQGGATTTDVPEGTQFYFTDARVYTKVKAMLVQGTNVTLTANDGAQTITIDAASSGDMLKATYDTDDDGVVDAAETAVYAADAGDADTLDGNHAADFAAIVHGHDAVDVDVAATPANYTPADVDVEAHLAAIDTAIGTLGSATGDMTKAVYDTDDNGAVDSADYATTAGDADTVDGSHAADFATAGHNHDAAYAPITVTQYTDELAQDAVGGMVADTNTVDLTYTDGTPALTADVKKQMSITSDASGLKLEGDAATPGNSKYYGTDGGGTKGFHAVPAGSTDEKAKVSSNDTTAGYLNGKLVAGTYGTLTENSDGGNETLTVDITVAKDIVCTAPLTVNAGTNLDNVLPGADADVTLALTQNLPGINRVIHFTVIDPPTAYSKSTIVPIVAKTIAALHIKNIEFRCNDNPATEPTGDIKYADDLIGLANSAVIQAIDTAAGTFSSGAINVAVGSGKCIYLSYDTAPLVSTFHACTITFQYD